MIGRAVIDERVREWGLREDVVEKDYVIGWLLWGIGSDATLANGWIFKGGTCLKKCYLETYRFSEDLDFTVVEGAPIEPEQVASAMGSIIERVQQASGVNFSVRAPRFEGRAPGVSVEGRVYYSGPRGTPSPGSIKIDLRGDEKVVQPTVLRAISHAYPDVLPEPATVRCYGFEEVFAEKLRALAERLRPRDLYDVVNLYRIRDFEDHGSLIRQVLGAKCESKGISFPSLNELLTSSMVPELEAQWENMLAHQLPALPPFNGFWQEVPKLFAWLDGEVVQRPEPQPVSSDEVPGWTPPPTIWTWGAGVPIEAVRFAGSNRLCVELGYQNSVRLVEPYSLRRTKAGNIVLHALKHESREARSYRVDRIQSVKVSNVSFNPVYAIELAAAGPLSIPQTARRAATSTPRRRVRNPRTHGITYIIECYMCGKRFRRAQLTTLLNPHKDKAGWSCSGRSGYYVDTVYG